MIHMNGYTTTLVRVNKGRPCPICGNTEWCRVAASGGYAVCNRVESEQPARGGGEGFVHALGPNARPAATATDQATARPPLSPEEIMSSLFFPAVNTTAADVKRLALELKVSALSLSRVRFKYHLPFDEWWIPMFDGDREFIGIHRRLANGDKRCLSRSRLGLFIPTGVAFDSGVLFVCEGASDTAAALDLGFNAIGRPTCTGCFEHVATLLMAHPNVTPVIVADNDAPGILGAKRLAERLVDAGVRPRVRVIVPPGGFKDLRAIVAANRDRLAAVAQHIIDQIS